MAKKVLILGIALYILFSLAACKQEEVESMGTLYSLQAAYDEGLLTVDDLRSIAYYHNDNIQYPEVLDEKIEQTIKKTYAEIIRTRSSNPHTEATTCDVSIIRYFGTYNDCVAVILFDSFTDYPSVMREKKIAGVTFVYSGANITIWNKNKIKN